MTASDNGNHNNSKKIVASPFASSPPRPTEANPAPNQPVLGRPAAPSANPSPPHAQPPPSPPQSPAASVELSRLGASDAPPADESQVKNAASPEAKPVVYVSGQINFIKHAIEQQQIQLEKDTRNMFAELSLWERICYSAQAVWAYKSNFILSGVSLSVVIYLFSRQLLKLLQAPDPNLPLIMVLFFGFFLITFILYICFAALVRQVVIHGDPDSSVDILVGPLKRLGELLLPLCVLSLGLCLGSGLLFVVTGEALFSGGHGSVSVSGVGLVASGFVLLAPICLCYIFYFVETEDIGLVDGLLEPLNLLMANPWGWLSIVPVIIGITIVTMIALRVIIAISLISFILLLAIMAFQVVLATAICFMALSYISVYACYIYQQTITKIEFDED